jgi:hypothetical protein
MGRGDTTRKLGKKYPIQVLISRVPVKKYPDMRSFEIFMTD